MKLRVTKDDRMRVGLVLRLTSGRRGRPKNKEAPGDPRYGIVIGIVGESPLVIEVSQSPDGSYVLGEISYADRYEIAGMLPGLSRIDQPTQRTHGWFPRLHYIGSQAEKMMFFGDGVNADIRGSLQKALDWLVQQRENALESAEIEG